MGAGQYPPGGEETHYLADHHTVNVGLGQDGGEVYTELVAVSDDLRWRVRQLETTNTLLMERCVCTQTCITYMDYIHLLLLSLLSLSTLLTLLVLPLLLPLPLTLPLHSLQVHGPCHQARRAR